MEIRSSRARTVAVLGPTNTGKTHLAMERMLGHASGMMGFPLRLLARENYERAVAARGAERVALITGEEKIVPAGARYFLCTAESMPIDRRVDFVGLDEVQMCADPERGHIFTERLLNIRGAAETMLLGAETMRPVLRALVPDAEYISRPRFSTLTYTGPRKITRLPRRAAVVAFSAAEVYAIAELVRRQRGGAAVVLGALSPRTRNAQVGMFQAGEVDYLIATDAIGMGLNMDLDHVAFAATRKFDGRAPRALSAAEMAQIAGRAGRHMNDGTFGTAAEVGSLDPDIVARIESHSFDPLTAVYWRNDRLRFDSVATLMRSLARPPEQPGLIRAREADDERALAELTRDTELAALAQGRNAVMLLWEVCRIPDFRKVMSDAHARLLGRIYRFLVAPGGRLPTDWLASQVTRVERTDGDIDTLMQRIAAVRIWTYVAHRGDWVDDAGHWQERTHVAEDRLSDALHERLTQRFVDRRTAVLMGRLRDKDALDAIVESDGAVTVEGHEVGRLRGFQFLTGEAPTDSRAAKAVASAARRALDGELSRRLRHLEEAGDDAFALDSAGHVTWAGAPVARLAPGASILRPALTTDLSETVNGPARERIRQRLSRWLEAHVRQRLAPLFNARGAALEGIARGLIFELTEAMGSLPRAPLQAQVAGLDAEARRSLRRLGIVIGRDSIFMPALLKPAAVALRALLWANQRGIAAPPAPAPGRVSLPADDNLPTGFYEAVGFRVAGRLAVRIDILERLAEQAWTLAATGPFAVGPEMLNLLGCQDDDLAAVLADIGFVRHVEDDGSVRFVRPSRDAAQRQRQSAAREERTLQRRKGHSVASESPFAKLREIAFSR